ncbi:helix-hairpin-helix domain-containing protein [Marinilabilia salmonicolor]|uniref:helix-hairpin-helix domain-containing protein n=1 Tax=Marinilabilia salmonicolor TaxID=989 RepID=UPI00029A6320|nr:helix-hairpin-helix domain-containing protein [Marinilabilia salmonicolor]
MWKDWLAFSRREQYGLVLLSFLIVLLVVIRFLLPVVSEPPEIKVISEVEILSELEQSSKMKSETESSVLRNRRQFNFSTFNPNTVSVTKLSRMGIPSYVIINWIKFREAGGVFYKGEEIGKIYGLDSIMLTQMLPFVKIEDPSGIKPDKYDKPEKGNAGGEMTVDFGTERFNDEPLLIIDLNKADTLELQRIKGIGPVFSRRIVDFRNLLGGFYSVEQLREVYGLPSGLVDEVSDCFVVSPDDVVKMDVNTFALRKLKAHPYVNFYQAREIVEYQKKNGVVANKSVLETFKSFDKESLERVLPYLCFNEKNSLKRAEK